MVLFMVSLMLTVVGCQRDSVIVSRNISKEADQFRVRRRIVFYNAITNTYMFEMIGNCSVNVDRGRQSIRSNS